MIASTGPVITSYAPDRQRRPRSHGPSVFSEDLHRRVRDSELSICPASGHGGVFQYHEQFAPVAAAFLGD